MFMDRVKKTITLPDDVVKWAKTELDKGAYSGVRSFSGLIEYLLRKEMKIAKR